LLLAAIHPKADGEIFNLGSSEYINLKDLASLMVELYQEGTYELIPFPPDRKKIDIGDYYSDYTKINQALNWSPSISLREGLQQTLNYYRQHHHHYWTDAEK